MLEPLSIAEIDRLLNELEELARTASTRKRFLDTALERLKFLLNATGAGLLIKTEERGWILAAHLGQLALKDIREHLQSSQLSGDGLIVPDARAFIVPLRPGQWQRGALVVQLQQSLTESGRMDVQKLCEAIAEIVSLRQSLELEELLDSKWIGFQQSLAESTHARSLEESAIRMVNDLSAILQADRVSLVRRRDGYSGLHVLATSGVSKVHQRAAAVAAIESACLETIRQQQSQARHESQTMSEEPNGASSQGATLLAHSISVPLMPRRQSTSTSSKPNCRAAVLFEWNDIEGFLAGAMSLNYIFPAFANNWLFFEKWHRLPSWVRVLFGSSAEPRFYRSSSLIVRTVLLVGLLAALSWLIFRPTTLRIEAEGTLQPTEQRVVFAPRDGIVESLDVEDGEYIEEGTPIASMYSRMLDIEIQEVAGRIRSNVEKLDGLNVAINQLTRDTAEVTATQSRLSSDIRELETLLKILKDKRESLLEEREKLKLVAPISGTIVAPQAERFLKSRPVKRGDALLRVVNLQGPWHLEIKVADRDSGYVRQKLLDGLGRNGGQIPEGAHADIEYVMVAHPTVPQRARATWISEAVRNTDGEGMFVDLKAAIDRKGLPNPHMGANVFAYVECGQEPCWFVWSRPLIEAIQRRLWF